MTLRRTLAALGRRVFVLALLGYSLLVAPSVARADGDPIEKASARVFELETRLTDLDRRLKPPEDPQGQLAERRLVDAEVAYELKNYEASSIILYDIIDKYPSSRVYPEALYYLSDSLYLKRDYFSSRRYFEKLVEIGPSSGKYQEALQRLVELSLHTGDYSPVDGYLAKLALLPIGEQLPSVPYVAGKYHYFRQQYDQAIAVLRALPTTHKFYLHGQYFVAASLVAMGGDHLNEAITTFDNMIKLESQAAADTAAADKAAAAATPATTNNKQGAKAQKPGLSDAEKLILELAHLGRARILVEQGQPTAALEEYVRIGSTSSNFSDALYESAWVNIKAKEYRKAARQLDLLLLSAPDSSLAPEVRLLTGNLFIRESQFGLATSSFSKTREEYEPLSKSLQLELGKSADPVAYFRDMISKNLAHFDTGKILPSSANRWVKDDPAVARLRELLVDEGDLDKSLGDADETIRRLEHVIDSPARVNVFPELAHARTRGVEVGNALTEVRKILSERERKLIEPVAGGDTGQLKALQDEQGRLEAQLKLMPTKEETIADRQKKAREAFNELDKRASEALIDMLGVRAQAVATNKFYHDQIEHTLPPEQQQQAQQELDRYLAELDAEQRDLDAVRKELDEAEQSVGIDDADMKEAEALKAKYEDVLARQHAILQQASSRLGSGDRVKAEQIEAILLRARSLDEKLGQYNRKIDSLLDEKMGPIRATINEEKARVVGYKQTLGGYTGESTELGGGVVAQGLRNVSQRFYNVVVRADVGIIDVAWALKDSATKEGSRLASERKRELKLLDDEFKEVLKERP